MKKILHGIFFFIIASKILSAQTIPTFCLSLGLSSSRNLCGTSTYDGNYVAAGIVSIGSNQNNFVAKCDVSGNILWWHEVGSDFTDDFFGITETSDHSIVVVGLANAKMCMVKYDHDGNEIWKKDIVIQDFDYLYDLIETSDGNYLLAGVSETIFPSYYYCAVIKVSTDGDLLWNKNFYGTYHGEIGYSITETADHRYVIGGYSSVFSDQYFILSVDESGTLQWVKKTVDGGVAYDLVATSDSSVVVAGYTCTASGCDANLSKIDASGNLVWSYTYGDSLFDRFYSVVQLPDGGFAMAGDATDQLYTYLGFVVKTDSDGQMQWGKIVNDDREFRSIGNSGDGGIMMSSTGGGGFRIVKMDGDGNTCPDCPSGNYGVQGAGTTFTDWTLNEFNAVAMVSPSAMAEANNTPTITVACNEAGIKENENENFTPRIFPNPAAADFQVTIPSNFHADKIFITDVNGKIIYSNSVSSVKKILIGTSSFLNGIYSVQVRSDSKIAMGRVAIIH